MAEMSKYFVPKDDAHLLGKEREIADAFWNVGLFITTEDQFIYQRIKDCEKEGRPPPESLHDFTFAEMGLGGSPSFEPVPNSINDLACPKCGSDLLSEAYEEWEDEDSEVALPLRTVTCPSCNTHSKSAELKSEDPFTFSRFYLWVSDIESEDWDESFKASVEKILGPCQEITAWEI
ncbi:hypothetical protein [Piscinibacter sp. HJYY11]|uniref:hypothetical protein n=1 Tax=Piscinibacter sp. HJYY11 TaxID=2801333 RepID=UPI00191EA4C5|nr:hypothetical protein [Piscinibacter sp. HJYY11]MBL0731211.1 hypothetical protein [Piscinibacter sp. HJYY11]